MNVEVGLKWKKSKKVAGGQTYSPYAAFYIFIFIFCQIDFLRVHRRLVVYDYVCVITCCRIHFKSDEILNEFCVLIKHSIVLVLAEASLVQDGSSRKIGKV